MNAADAQKRLRAMVRGSVRAGQCRRHPRFHQTGLISAASEGGSRTSASHGPHSIKKTSSSEFPLEASLLACVTLAGQVRSITDEIIVQIFNIIVVLDRETTARARPGVCMVTFDHHSRQDWVWSHGPETVEVLCRCRRGLAFW